MQANVLATVWPLNAKFSMPTKLALPVERPWSVVDTSQQLPALKKAKHYNSFSRYYKLSIWIYLDLSGLPSAHLSNVSFAQRAHEGTTESALKRIAAENSKASGGKLCTGCPSVLFENIWTPVFVQLCKCLSNCQCGSKDIVLQKRLKALTCFDGSSIQIVQTSHHIQKYCYNTVALHIIYIIIHIIIHNYVNYVLASCNSCNIMWLYHVTPKHHLSWYTKEMCRRRLSGDIAS